MPTYEEMRRDWEREQARRKREGPTPKSEQRRAQRLFAARVEQSRKDHETRQRDQARHFREEIRERMDDYLRHRG